MSHEQFYYYLDPDRQPKGPLTLAELEQKMEQGLLTPDTMICKEGDAAWQTLRSIMSAPTTVSAHRTIESAKLLHHTNIFGLPAVEYESTMSFLEIFRHVTLDKFATFRGRATRREYWAFAACDIVANVLLSLISIITAGLGSMLQALYWIFTLVPRIALQSRRLHDTGRSAWWIITCFIISTISGASMISVAYVTVTDIAMAVYKQYPEVIRLTQTDTQQLSNQEYMDLLIALDQQRAEREQENNLIQAHRRADGTPEASAEATVSPLRQEIARILQMKEEKVAELERFIITESMQRGLASLPLMLLLLLMAFAPVLLLFFFSLRDSQKGSNKFGPSYKYPDPQV